MSYLGFFFMQKSYFQRIGLLQILLILSFSVFSQWKSLPIRSQQEFNLNAAGGEGEQYLHGFSRCLTQPDYVYAGQDVCGSWRSVDGGTTWKKNLDKGLYLSYSQSIEVDPIDPNKVFIVVDQSSSWAGKVLNYEGVYQSLDGGRSWALVLNSVQNSVRKMRHLIAYSKPSMVNGKVSPTRWFAADSKSLWRSDLSGNSGSWVMVAAIPVTAIVTDVITHPTSIDTVYVATETGLYRSTDGGSNLSEISQFATKKVTSVLMNAALPNKIYVTVSGEGVYYSSDNGASFTLKTITVGGTNINASIYRAVMNAGFPEQIYLIGSESSSKNWITNDGMATWKLLPAATTFPGLGRETGWRRYLDGVFCGICPNPLDKTNAIGTSRSTFHKITNSGGAVTESATGFTGNAAMQTDRSIAFHPYDSTIFGIFCFDVGPRITFTKGDWFYPSDPIIYTWRATGKTKWAGSYSAAFQPVVGSKVVVASIGMYISTNQIMRSVNNGLTWGSLPITPNTTADLQAFNFIAFDPELTNIVYAGSLISKDAGLTFNPIAFPAAYTTSLTCGVSQDPITGKSYVFAIDNARTAILRSDDHGETWFLFYNLALVGGSAKFLDSTPTFAAHPSNPNIVFALDKNRDLLKVVFDPIAQKATSVGLNSFAALPTWMPADVRTYNQIRRIGIDPVDPNVIYVSMLVSGIPSIYRTLNGGQTWASISDDLNYQGGCVVVNPHTRELYKGSMSGTSIFPAAPTNPSSVFTIRQSNTLSAYVDLGSSMLFINGYDEKDLNVIFSISGKTVKRFLGSSESLADLSSGMYLLMSGGRKPVRFCK
jgi:photosystem II stability/assembly factor-like uncharacterized protein